jgi:hypothetical protein
MPTNYGSQNVRVVTGLLNTMNDDYPGGGSQAPGFAPAQLGQRVILGVNEVKSSHAIGDLYEGTYQYVQTYSSDTVSPARGLLAFWRDRATYLVTTSDATGSELAGVFINPITKGKYGFIQAIQGGRGVVQSSTAGGALGDIAVVNQAAGTAIAISATVAAVTAAQLSLRFAKLLAAPVATFTLVAFDTQTV